MSLSKLLQWGKRKISPKKTDNDLTNFAPGAVVRIDPTQWVTSTMSLSSMVEPGFAEDFIFRGQESITQKTFMKRIEKFRKKYPQHADCLETMKKKAYP